MLINRQQLVCHNCGGYSGNCITLLVILLRVLLVMAAPLLAVGSLASECATLRQAPAKGGVLKRRVSICLGHPLWTSTPATRDLYP
jgi:hypothetical protein